MTNKNIDICSVGWGLELIQTYIEPVFMRLGLGVAHIMVDNNFAIENAKNRCGELNIIDILQHDDPTLPEPDIGILSDLESYGNRTIRSMILGDRVLRNRNPTEALSYATLLAKNLIFHLSLMRPKIIIGGFDSLHSGISLLVSNKLGIQWIAFHHTVIPRHLLGFCNGLTPNSLIPIVRNKNNELKNEAIKIISQLKGEGFEVVAYRAPTNPRKIAGLYFSKIKNQLLRLTRKSSAKDRFIYPLETERAFDAVRRIRNYLSLFYFGPKFYPPQSKYIYFPLHMLPESSVDTWAPFYMEQISIVRQLAMAMPIDVHLVVKIHYSDPDNYGYKELSLLSRIPGVSIMHPMADGKLLLRNAAMVATIQGTAALEGALIGKPVLLFGDSPYQYFPRSERAKGPDQITSQIARMLLQTKPYDDEIVEAYVDYLRRFLPGRDNNWQEPTTEDHVTRLSHAFKLLFEFRRFPVG